MNAQPPVGQKLVPWPDMSAYGVYFGIVKGKGGGEFGEPSLVMIDESGTFDTLAKGIGFKRTRWFGLWAKKGLGFSIPYMKRNFPMAKIAQRTPDEIHRIAQEKITGRKNQRLSQMGSRKMGWHPGKMTPAVESISRLLAGVPAPSVLEVTDALNQTLFLGHNSTGGRVYESGDGSRFISADGIQIAERESMPSARFLRVGDGETLVECAAGLAWEMNAGHCLKSEDFERYLMATLGQEAIEDPTRVSAYQSAIDIAMRSIIKAASKEDAYGIAVRLHENRPSYWRAPGTLPTPAPILVAMQEILYGLDGGCIDCSANSGSSSWVFENAIRISPESNEIPEHAIFIGGSFNHEIDVAKVGGLRLTRRDHEMVVRSLERRSASGTSAFIVVADGNGRLSPESRRLLAWIGMRYKLIGVTDIASSMISAGNMIDSRLIIVGDAYAEQDLSYAPPMRLPVLYDYDALRRWTSTARRNIEGENVAYEEEAVISEAKANNFQAPYIPSSQVSEPAMMSPRNLLASMRIALSRIAEKHGTDIDDFVAEKLGVPVESLPSRFSAEQVDAVAIGINAIDEKSGFIEADMTGVGKGRVLAALMYYTKRIGKTPFFLTENSDLYTALYRDIADIGFLEEFRRPFIMNSDGQVVDGNNKVIARPESPDYVMSVMSSGKLPEEFDCILGTYGQFNREPPAEGLVMRHRAHYQLYSDLEMQTPVVRSVSRILANAELAEHLDGVFNIPKIISNLFAYNLIDATRRDEFLSFWDEGNGNDADIARWIEKVREQFISTGSVSEHTLALDRALDLLAGDPQATLEKAKSGMLDNMALRQHWIRAIEGGFVLLADESHNMAGPTSNTNANLNYAVLNADAFIGSSATFASSEDNFGIYCRIFPKLIDVKEIAATLKKGGEPLQEIFSGMVAKDGRMIRREHDFSNVEIKTFIDTAREERNRSWADRLAAVLNMLSILSGEVNSVITKTNDELDEAFELAIKAGQQDATKIGVQNTNFGSRFFMINQQFLMAVNADNVADLAIGALKNGLKPVIYSENTLESPLRDILLSTEELLESSGEEEGGAISGDRIPVPEGKATFRRVLRNYAKTLTHAVEIERKGKKIIKKTFKEIKDPSFAPLIKAIDQLIDELPDIPLSPIDLVKERIAKEGFSVDEITKRKLSIEYGKEVDTIVRRKSRKKKLVRDDFNDGRVDALIISRAGATGTDLHSAAKFGNQSQRVFIPMKPPIDIVKFTQGMGRVNRKDQVCPPVVYVPYAGLPGEKRFIIIFKQKMRKMSASVTANADTTSNEDYDAPDIINRVGNKICFDFLSNEPDYARRLGFDARTLSEGVLGTANTHFIDKVTSRITMLDCESQEFVYKQLEDGFKAYIDRCEAEGWNPFHAHRYDIKAKEETRKMILPGDASDPSVFAGPVYASVVTWEGEVIPPPVPADKFIEIIGSNLADFKKHHRNGYTVAQKILAHAKKILPSMLPEGETIESMLASNKPNRIKNLNDRVKNAEVVVTRLAPGAVFRLNTADGYSDAIVIDLHYPHDATVNFSEYEVRILSDKHPRGAWVSLSSLAGMHDMLEVTSMPGDCDHDEKVKRFVDGRFTARKEIKKRVMLTGNLYRAAELAAKLNKGNPATYTDENGMWRQVIAMSALMTLDEVMSLPIEIENTDMALDYFRFILSQPPSDEVFQKYRFTERLSVADTFNIDKIMIKLKYHHDKRMYELKCYGDAEKFNWLLDSKELCSMTGRSFEGDSGNRSLFIPDTVDRQMFDILLPLCANNKYPLLISPDEQIRQWFISRSMPQVTHELDEIEVLVSDDFEVDLEIDIDPQNEPAQATKPEGMPAFRM